MLSGSIGDGNLLSIGKVLHPHSCKGFSVLCSNGKSSLHSSLHNGSTCHRATTKTSSSHSSVGLSDGTSSPGRSTIVELSHQLLKLTSNSGSSLDSACLSLCQCLAEAALLGNHPRLFIELVHCGSNSLDRLSDLKVLLSYINKLFLRNSTLLSDSGGRGCGLVCRSRWNLCSFSSIQHCRSTHCRRLGLRQCIVGGCSSLRSSRKLSSLCFELCCGGFCNSLCRPANISHCSCLGFLLRRHHQRRRRSHLCSSRSFSGFGNGFRRDIALLSSNLGLFRHNTSSRLQSLYSFFHLFSSPCSLCCCCRHLRRLCCLCSRGCLCCLCCFSSASTTNTSNALLRGNGGFSRSDTGSRTRLRDTGSAFCLFKGDSAAACDIACCSLFLLFSCHTIFLFF